MKHSVVSNPLVAFPNPWSILTEPQREAEEASQYLSRYREDHPLHPDPAAGGAAAFACCCQKRCPLASWAAAQETMTAPISCSYRCASMQSNQ